MNFEAIFFVLVVITKKTLASPDNTETLGTYLAPRDPVKKVGDVIQFECRCENCTGSQYEHLVTFRLQHNGTDISESGGADSMTDVYLEKEFSKTVTAKHDAGIYTCVITTSGNAGKVVRVDTNLVVLEDKTVFGEMGKETKLSCIDTKTHSQQDFVTEWGVDGVDQKSDSMYFAISKTVKEDAFKSYKCLVTSKTAVDTYGSIENATRKGAAAEISLSLSVIDVIDCPDRKACVLEAIVYGETAVNITWLVDGKLLVTELEIDKNVTKSKTPVLNITSTTLVELRVTDGYNIWRKNISEAARENGDNSSPSDTGIVIGVIAGVIVIAGVVIFIVVRKVRNRNRMPGGPETQGLNETAGTDDNIPMGDIPNDRN